MENKGQQYSNARFGILQALHTGCAGTGHCKHTAGGSQKHSGRRSARPESEWSEEAKENRFNRGPVTFQPVEGKERGRPGLAAGTLASVDSTVKKTEHSKLLSGKVRTRTTPSP